MNAIISLGGGSLQKERTAKTDLIEKVEKAARTRACNKAKQ